MRLRREILKFLDSVFPLFPILSANYGIRSQALLTVATLTPNTTAIFPHDIPCLLISWA